MLERAKTNCYLVVVDSIIVLVDAGLPRTWPVLKEALSVIGASPDDIGAVVLTHGHFDHVGMCDRLITEHHVRVHVHDGDRPLARHPYRYAHEQARWKYPVQYPQSIPVLTRMAAAGALGVKGVSASGEVHAGVPLPAGLIPVASPGHTVGHHGFLLERTGVLFTGDAIVTFDPYTGKSGPRIVAGAATGDSAAALDALGGYADTEATLLLPGHGEPFTGSARRAVHLAREAGAW